jgi:GNAT superfamily N-acetyltransferase
MKTIHLALEPHLSTDEFIDVLVRSTLAERRPVDDLDRMTAMLRNAQIIATARDESGLLVGIARAISDFAYCTYLSELAVDVAYQRRGIGKQLIEFVRVAAGPQSRLILLSAPAAVEYYPHIGMTAHPSCWMLPAPGDE